MTVSIEIHLPGASVAIGCLPDLLTGASRPTGSNAERRPTTVQIRLICAASCTQNSEPPNCEHGSRISLGK